MSNSEGEALCDAQRLESEIASRKASEDEPEGSWGMCHVVELFDPSALSLKMACLFLVKAFLERLD